MVSVVIPTIKGREELLKRLLDSLPKNIERIIVNDDIPLSAKRNKGAKKARGRHILFIDDDNYLSEGAIEEAVRSFRDESVGVVGMVACYDSARSKVADGGSRRNMLTGFTRGLFTNEEISSLPQIPYEVDEAANAFMVRRQLWRNLGGFDEINFPIDLDEADFCKRVKNTGLKVVYCPTAVCYHNSITYSHIPDFRRSKNAYFMSRNRQLYQRKHLSILRYYVYVCFFCPVFVCFYTASMLWRKKFSMIPHIFKGVFDGLLGRRKNSYQ